MSSELLPCPFCGGEAEIVEVTDNPPETIAIQCKSGCGVSVHHKWLEEGVLIERWNTRAERTCGLRSRLTGPYCYECTECGKGMKPEWAYCPRCGAKVGEARCRLTRSAARWRQGYEIGNHSEKRLGNHQFAPR